MITATAAWSGARKTGAWICAVALASVQKALCIRRVTSNDQLSGGLCWFGSVGCNTSVIACVTSRHPFDRQYWRVQIIGYLHIRCGHCKTIPVPLECQRQVSGLHDAWYLGSNPFHEFSKCERTYVRRNWERGVKLDKDIIQWWCNENRGVVGVECSGQNLEATGSASFKLFKGQGVMYVVWFRFWQCTIRH